MRWAWASALAAVLLAGCAGDDAGACGPDENLLESRAATHVVDPDAAEFDHHPPTGGPHTQAEPDPGVHDEPLPEALQVTGLETGMVAVNYDESLPGDDVRELESLQRSYADLIVAPAAVPIDGGAPIAFTAWEHRMLCEDVDLDAAREFIERHAGQAEVE